MRWRHSESSPYKNHEQSKKYSFDYNSYFFEQENNFQSMFVQNLIQNIFNIFLKAKPERNISMWRHLAGWLSNKSVDDNENI